MGVCDLDLTYELLNELAIEANKVAHAKPGYQPWHDRAWTKAHIRLVEALERVMYLMRESRDHEQKRQTRRQEASR